MYLAVISILILFAKELISPSPLNDFLVSTNKNIVSRIFLLY